jgi:hypothetical protein
MPQEPFFFAISQVYLNELAYKDPLSGLGFPRHLLEFTLRKVESLAPVGSIVPINFLLQSEGFSESIGNTDLVKYI